ncbi:MULTISPECIES: hypothetical protein [unclassified Streptomyces]|uniref:hypothetical protein n=1 Tax=unclassified Streptomyces TaxID=2593676 RepID=UPI0022532A80|nr:MULTISPECIES: hypothetical protein [unclassified Streptomyces]MCX5061764.1 hypothetical protein [Streptomyces sp. NBC_00452]MCX5292625.1 hypothetical protein [Streptomyces sp. NBC_00183]
MPHPPAPRAPSGPRRRSLFASAAGAALLVGCSSGSEDSEESTGGSPSVIQKARALAARESVGMLGRYDAVIAAHPAVSQRLGPLRAEVARHTEAFGGTVRKASSPPAPEASASQTSASQTSASPSAAAPVSEKDALAELAAAERALADRRTAALLDVPGELARLLASVAAAGAAHAYLLTEGAK